MGLKPHNVGYVSDKAIKMVDNRKVFQSTLYMLVFPLTLPTDTPTLLDTHYKSIVSMGVCLTIDDSGTPSIGDLGLASMELDRAHASFERTGDGSQVFMAASQCIDQGSSVVQIAASTRPAAKTNSGVVGDALRCLDVVVKFVDSISQVISSNTIMTIMSSYIQF
jgi:hypothetical protein